MTVSVEPEQWQQRQHIIRDWWRRLEDREVEEQGGRRVIPGHRGERAELTRCGTPQEARMCAGYQRLRLALIEAELFNCRAMESDDHRLAVVAAVLSHVREDVAAEPARASQTGDMALALALPAEGNDKPRMSGLRFRRLIQAEAPDEVLRLMVRAVRLNQGRASVISLARDLLDWASGERDYVRIAWATRYYERALDED